jgi:hypothetical protein
VIGVKVTENTGVGVVSDGSVAVGAVSTSTVGVVSETSVAVGLTNTRTVGVISETSVAIGVVSTVSAGVLVGILGLQGDPGSINWKGPYNALTPYVADDVVSSNGSSWVCLVACTDVTPAEGVNWSLIAAAGGEMGNLDMGSYS